MWWLRLFGLALELLLPPSSFSARGVSAFHFPTLEDFVRSARIVIYCHVKAHPPTRRSRLVEQVWHPASPEADALACRHLSVFASQPSRPPQRFCGVMSGEV